MMYDELIKALRWNGDEYLGNIMDDDDKKLYRDAADAIERLEKIIEQQYETIEQLDADLEAAYNH